MAKKKKVLTAKEQEKAKMIQIRDDILPRGYGKTIKKRLAEKKITVTESNVRQVAGGHSFNKDIRDEILLYAEELLTPKENETLLRMDKILAKKKG